MKEITLSDDPTPARARAEAAFKKEQQRVEGAIAMADYEAQAQAVRESTARLRELRLAKEAADMKKEQSTERPNRTSRSDQIAPRPLARATTWSK
jgi:hypothetical protein